VDELAARLNAPHDVAVDAARWSLEQARRAILEGRPAPDPETCALARLAANRRRHLRRVINATGLVIHTNLGRAPLPAAAVFGYCNVEYDLEAGHRGSRLAGVGPLLEHLSGAESSLVVNNCAAALVLALTALRQRFGRAEVLISRGELVEIGGSFRIPEIIETSGATLREVGTTNKTRAADYARAITPSTLAILRVHPSNFEILGFRERPAPHELIALARSHALPFLYDLGTDLLGAPPLPLAPNNPWAAELDAREALMAGADLVMFSGDKLLGGPQAGIVLGRGDLVATMSAHPLMRALRVDKVGLGLLEHVLRARLLGDWQAVPTLAMLYESVDALGARARRLARRFEDAGIAVELVPTSDAVGGGSHPGHTLPGVGLAVCSRPDRPIGANALATRLRSGDPAVVSFIDAERVVLALRTLSEADEEPLIEALVTALDIPASTL
jgi:L-seryl-tRNA(Ser) seleniumtransferase